MSTPQTITRDGRSTRTLVPTEPTKARPPALGDVARDVMDHATLIVRDQVEIGRLEARRYADHVRRDVAPRAARTVAVLALAGVAAACGLVALFLGIARALGSVAWTFAIYGVLFAAAALIARAAMAPR
jgi:uncharacterized membrane protein